MICPREHFWDLATTPTPRYFMAPFGGDAWHLERDLGKAERATDRAFEKMSKHLHETMQEMAPETRGKIEVKNEPNKLEIKLDVHDYKPEELWVKTTHHTLVIHGKHEEKDEKDGKHHVKREFTRKFLLPAEVDPQTVSSSLTKDGMLMVEAPKKAIEHKPAERIIAIEHK